MRKLFTLLSLALCAIGVQAQDCADTNHNQIGHKFTVTSNSNNVKYTYEVTSPWSNGESGEVPAVALVGVEMLNGNKNLTIRVEAQDTQGSGFSYQVKYIDSKLLVDRQDIETVKIPGNMTDHFYMDYPTSGYHTFNAWMLKGSSIKSITIDNTGESNTTIKSEDGIVYSYDGKKVLICPPAKTGNYVVPETVVEIGESAFQFSSIENVDFRKATKLDIIHDYAFSESSINNVEISEDIPLRQIGWGAFEYCSSLKSVDIPSTVTAIGVWAFGGCKNLKEFRCAAGATPNIETSPSFGNSPFKSNVQVRPSSFSDEDRARYEAFGVTPTNEGILYVPAKDANQQLESQWHYDVAPWTEWGTCNSSEVWFDDQNSTAFEVPQVSNESKHYRVTYDRGLNVGVWGAMYVPISIDVERYSDKIDFAEIFTVSPINDDNGNGYLDSEDKSYLIVSLVKTGKTVPNKPYLIRAKESGSYTMEAVNQTAYPNTRETVKANKMTFNNTQFKYEVEGNYSNTETKINPNDNRYYMSGKGNLSHLVNAEAFVLNPYRWFIQVSADSKYNPVDPVQLPAKMAVLVLGEDDPTAISNVLSGNGVANLGTYTIDGRKVAEGTSLKAGIYIKNGKKFIVK